LFYVKEKAREREREYTHTHTHRGRQRHTEIIEIHTYIYAHSEEQVGMEMIGEKEGAGVDYLAEERAGAQFDLHSMKLFLAGGQHAYDVSKRMADLVANDPVFAKEDRVRVPRKEHYKNSLRKAGHAWKTILEQGLTGTYFIT
jgi:hypothetical protein